MTPLEIIKSAQDSDLRDEDDERVEIELMPGLSPDEIDRFVKKRPCAVPPHIRELLGYCGGFNGVWDGVDFTGRLGRHFFEEVFPHALPIAADGSGNYWVVDLHAGSTDWGPIYFACHDPPIVLFQSDSLAGFLTELFNAFRPPFKSQVNEVHADQLADVWSTNPGVLSCEACLVSQDSALASFAAQLDPTFQFVDLRKAKPGDGFSWGRYGANTVVKRYGAQPIFAYQRPKWRGLLQRLFGR